MEFNKKRKSKDYISSITRENILNISNNFCNYTQLSKELYIHWHTLRKLIKKFNITKKELKFKKTKRKRPAWNKGLTKNNNNVLFEMSNKRKGNNNPMFGKDPWNKGLTKNDNNILKNISEKSKNRKFSKDHKEKLSESAKKRTIHGMSGKNHSLLTKEKLSIATIKMINEKRIRHTNSKPHIAVKNFLIEINCNFLEEAKIGLFCVDFLIGNIIIEVNGDYWHSNPLYYPNGPITKGQKINYHRDIRKYKFLKDNNYEIFIIWENEIKDKSFMEKIKCRLKHII